MRVATIAIAAFGLVSQTMAASAALHATAKPFETSLRRSIAVEGRENERFQLIDRMAHYRVPGVSVAVIDGCRIVDTRGFGQASISDVPVTPGTMFQAGSISKSLTAVAAMKLVEQGRLELDSDVRPLLKSWTLPDSPLLAGHPVTLRRLLNHTAGLTKVGGKGYARGTPLPTLAQILDGLWPANTPAIRVEKMPGTEWGYSSGGYYIAQALLTDTTGESFPQLIDRLVLGPAGMTSSSFAQPLYATRIRFAASAVGPDGTPLPQQWRVNPELAAGGLWSTPSDLARFAIALARAVRGDDQNLLGIEAARQLMARGLGDWGLGVDLRSAGGARRLGHTGHNVGFVSEFVMYPDTCQGAVVMTNADQGGWLATEVLRAIGDTYGWPDRKPLPMHAAVPLNDAIAERFVGTYRLRDFPAEQFTITRKPDGALYWARSGHIGRDLLPEHDGKLFSPDTTMTLEAPDATAERAATLDLRFGGGKNVAERID